MARELKAVTLIMAGVLFGIKKKKKGKSSTGSRNAMRVAEDYLLCNIMCR